MHGDRDGGAYHFDLRLAKEVPVSSRSILAWQLTAGLRLSPTDKRIASWVG